MRPMTRGSVALACALACGIVLRMLWPADMEWKADEQWMFTRASAIGISEPWPSAGMPSGVAVPNPGLSVWIFVPLARVAGNPVTLAQFVQLINVMALLGFAVLGASRAHRALGTSPCVRRNRRGHGAQGRGRAPPPRAEGGRRGAEDTTQEIGAMRGSAARSLLVAAALALLAPGCLGRGDDEAPRRHVGQVVRRDAAEGRQPVAVHEDRKRALVAGGHVDGRIDRDGGRRLGGDDAAKFFREELAHVIGERRTSLAGAGRRRARGSDRARGRLRVSE